MKRTHSFLPVFVLYVMALIFCLGARIWLKMELMDPVTGFYLEGSLLPTVFNIGLLAAFVLSFAFYVMRNTEADYPVYQQKKGLALLSLLTGVSIILYQFESLGFAGFGSINPGVQLERMPLIICTFLGEVSAFSFLLLGLRGLLEHRGMFGAVLPLVAGIWQLVSLVSKFNMYTTLTTISDNLLAVLFMLFSSMFLVGHARTLSGFARKDGRNYAIPTGLCASLCGFALVIPNWILLVREKSLIMSALLLGSFESIFVFLMSVYSVLFVVNIVKSIRRV